MGYTLWWTNILPWKMAIEIVDFPINSMVDLSMAKCWFTRGYHPKKWGFIKMVPLEIASMMVLLVLWNTPFEKTQPQNLIGNRSQIRVRFQTYTNETIKSWIEISPKACLADLKKLGLVGSENAGCLPCLNMGLSENVGLIFPMT